MMTNHRQKRIKINPYEEKKTTEYRTDKSNKPCNVKHFWKGKILSRRTRPRRRQTFFQGREKIKRNGKTEPIGF